MHVVWDSHPLKPPSSQATRSHPGKAKSYEPKTLNETMLPMRRKKSITISHTQHRTTPIPAPILTKEKEWGCEKKRRPTPGARKSKQREKQDGKLFNITIFLGIYTASMMLCLTDTSCIWNF